MRNDVRRLYAFADNPPDEQGYNRKLYIKSDYKFKQALPAIEQALDDFESAVKSAQLANNHRRKPKPNLTPNQHTFMLHLGDNNDILIVIPADKNLGPVMLERIVYIQRACQEHLGNERNYEQITKLGAMNRIQGLKYLFRDWLQHFKTVCIFEPTRLV